MIFAARERIPVGTPVTRCPPDRSQRAELPHWAPALGNDAQSLLKIGMFSYPIALPAVSVSAHFAGLTGSVSGTWVAETDSPRPVPFPPLPPQTAAHRGPCSEASPVLWDCLTSHVRSSLSCSLGIHSADLSMRPNVGPPGSRARSLCMCPRSLTTQGSTASHSIDTASVAFHLVDSVGTLKFTTSFAAQ